MLGGSIEVTANNGGDLIGVGGIIGQSRNNTAGVHMSNLYNAASVNVTSAVSTPPVRCGGIIGRIYQGGEIGSLTSCLNIFERIQQRPPTQQILQAVIIWKAAELPIRRAVPSVKVT